MSMAPLVMLQFDTTSLNSLNPEVLSQFFTLQNPNIPLPKQPIHSQDGCHKLQLASLNSLLTSAKDLLTKKGQLVYGIYIDTHSIVNTVRNHSHHLASLLLS